MGPPSCLPQSWSRVPDLTRVSRCRGHVFPTRVFPAVADWAEGFADRTRLYGVLQCDPASTLCAFQQACPPLRDSAHPSSRRRCPSSYLPPPLPPDSGRAGAAVPHQSGSPTSCRPLPCAHGSKWHPRGRAVPGAGQQPCFKSHSADTMLKSKTSPSNRRAGHRGSVPPGHLERRRVGLRPFRPLPPETGQPPPPPGRAPVGENTAPHRPTRTALRRAAAACRSDHTRRDAPHCPSPTGGRGLRHRGSESPQRARPRHARSGSPPA